MAVFRPSQRNCELNFDDKFLYRLPLTEKTALALDKAAAMLRENAPKDVAGAKATYGTAMGILDALLGKGAAGDIMSLFDDPGTLEAVEVFAYIAHEFKTAYAKELMRITKAPEKSRGRKK